MAHCPGIIRRMRSSWACAGLRVAYATLKSDTSTRSVLPHLQFIRPRPWGEIHYHLWCFPISGTCTCTIIPRILDEGGACHAKIGPSKKVVRANHFSLPKLALPQTTLKWSGLPKVVRVYQLAENRSLPSDLCV